MIEVLTITKVEVLALYYKYIFSSTYHLHAPRLEDRVAMYEEFLHASLRFPIHPFLMKILDFYQVVPTQLTLKSF